MNTRKLLSKVSIKTLGRICSAAIIVIAIAGWEAWDHKFVRGVFDGSAQACYWFAPDGASAYVLRVEQKNWNASPIRYVHLFGSRHPADDELTWYDEYNNPLAWRAEQQGDPNSWRYMAELRRPAFPGEWVRYTVWDRSLPAESFEGKGERWGTYQKENGNWVHHNSPGLHGRNTVSFVLPMEAEVVSAEPAHKARKSLDRDCSPVVVFTNIAGPLTVEWRIPPTQSQPEKELPAEK